MCFSPGTRVSSTNKIDCHDITEILLEVALNTITLTHVIRVLFIFYDFFVVVSVNETAPRAFSCQALSSNHVQSYDLLIGG
jgi:hypothetical protein